ncbi:hypothetical protein OAU50_00545 [Planctomycetota bacterium]|nr:hypothetical protein [Planctomycetota bacterium]
MRGLKTPLIVLAFGVLSAGVFTFDEWSGVFGGLFDDASQHATLPPHVGHSDPDGDEFDPSDPSHPNYSSHSANDAEDPESVEAARLAAERKRLADAEDARREAAKDKVDRAKADLEATDATKTAKEAELADAEEDETDVVETVEGQTVNPNLTGQLVRANGKEIKGWVQDKGEPESSMQVEILIDGRPAYTLTASQRVDHKKLGPIWYFTKPKPSELQGNDQHVIRALVFRADQHGKTELRGSPRKFGLGSVPRGKLEEASPENGISGYAFDPDKNKKPVRIRIIIDDETFGEVTANIKNAELKKRKITPTEKCAFKFDWPQVLDDGQDHTVQVHAQDLQTGDWHKIEGSPRVVNNRGGTANEPPIGSFTICNKYVMAGWAWDPDADNGPSDVEIWIDGEMLQQISANAKNESLRNSKRTPDAYHGWLYTTPGILLDGQSHTIRVYGVNYPSGAKVELQGSPKQYKMEENTAPMGGFWRADEKMLRGWAADPDLFSEPCEIEIYVDDKLWKTQKADRNESWITETGYAPDPEHGFLIEPPEFTDGKEHKITIYAKNFPEGPSKNLGTRWVGKTSIFPGFWVQDKLIDTRVSKGLYVRSVSPWFNAYHKDVKVGDVLLEYDGVVAGTRQTKDKDGKITQVGTMTGDFQKYINTNFKKNDLVKFKFWRNGETYEVQVKMGQLLGR